MNVQLYLNDFICVFSFFIVTLECHIQEVALPTQRTCICTQIMMHFCMIHWYCSIGTKDKILFMIHNIDHNDTEYHTALLLLLRCVKQKEIRKTIQLITAPQVCKTKGIRMSSQVSTLPQICNTKAIRSTTKLITHSHVVRHVRQKEYGLPHTWLLLLKCVEQKENGLPHIWLPFLMYVKQTEYGLQHSWLLLNCVY